jgi:ABC-2 type transport system permease protein
MSELTLPMPMPMPVPTRRAPLTRSLTMTARALRLTLRNPESLITALALPVILMVMFVNLFGGAMISTGTKYVDFVVPGVLLVCAGFGTVTTAVTVAQDLTGGIMDRFRSMDVSGAALVAGHVIASLVRSFLSTALVFAVALAIGFRSDATVSQWLTALAILALFIFALSWVAAAIGVAAGSVDAANGLAFLISFLAYPSSAFVPISTMPSWLQVFARNQPVTAVADTVRGLLDVGASAWHAVVWSVAIVAVSILGAGALFSRRRQA